MLKPVPARGFSVVEVMVTVAIVAIALSIAVPNFRNWTANTTVKGQAEAVLNGLQFARSEALRRNTKIKFTLTGGTGWKVGCVTIQGDLNGDGVPDCPATIQEKISGEAGTASIAVLPLGASTATFNSIGMITANADASPTLTQFDFSATAATRNPRVVLSAGGQARQCDPSVTAAQSPDKC